MPLIQYMQYITLPDGSPAADMAFPVHLTGGNVLIPTFTSKAGTAPLSNPVMTDGDGLLTFYAAPGAYCVDVGGIVFHLMVDATETDDAWPGTFVHLQNSAAQVWTVEHHFGIEPTVDNLILSSPTAAEVSHPDTETTIITFAAPTSGVAYLRR